MATAQERLHRLVDALPESELAAAERYIEYLCSHGDPFLCAIVNAPEADEPLSDEDRDALDEGLAAANAGDTVSDQDLRAELGICC